MTDRARLIQLKTQRQRIPCLSRKLQYMQGRDDGCDGITPTIQRVQSIARGGRLTKTDYASIVAQLQHANAGQSAFPLEMQRYIFLERTGAHKPGSAQASEAAL